MTLPQEFAQFISDLTQSLAICSSMVLSTKLIPQFSRQATFLNMHSSFLCLSMSFLKISPHTFELFGHSSSVNSHISKCLSWSHRFVFALQCWFGHFVWSSRTRRRIGIFGLSEPTILILHKGQFRVFWMHFSQKRLLQQGVSTASSKISRQIGHIQRSSARLWAEKYVNLYGPSNFLILESVLLRNLSALLICVAFSANLLCLFS